MDDPAARRAAMVAAQLEARGVRAGAVLRAMGTVPRERFVDTLLAEFAYADVPLPIGAGQTISQPYVVAVMAEAAELAATDVVLEVGAGCGYATAVFAQIAARVCAIERHAVLADEARVRLAALGLANIDLRLGDGSLGWPEARRFDAIIVSAAAPDVPEALRAQLAIGGRLVLPVGDIENQQLVKVVRHGEDAFAHEPIMAVRFVPLVGAQGWSF